MELHCIRWGPLEPPESVEGDIGAGQEALGSLTVVLQARSRRAPLVRNIAGCFGLLAAIADLLPDLTEPLRASLSGASDRGVATWEL